jgi:hypothetical protein
VGGCCIHDILIFFLFLIIAHIHTTLLRAYLNNAQQVILSSTILVESSMIVRPSKNGSSRPFTFLCPLQSTRLPLLV